MDPGPIHKRRRPAVTCTECRRRKIGCDLGFPCGPCRKSSAGLRCVYNNTNNNVGSKSSNTSAAASKKGGDSSCCNSDTTSDPSASLGGSSAPASVTSAASTPRVVGHSRKSSKRLRASSSRGSSMSPSHPGSLDQSMMMGVFPPLSDCMPLPEPEIFDENLLDLDLGALDVTPMHIDPKATDFFDTDFLSSAALPHMKSAAATWPAPYAMPSPTWPSLAFPSAPVHSHHSSLHLSGSETSSSASLSTLGSSNAAGEQNMSALDNRLPTLMRHILHGFASQACDDGLAFQPKLEMCRPLMETLAALDQVAQQDQERRATLLNWPSPASLNICTAWDLLPPRPKCDMLLDAYISNFESVLRILHVPSFLEEYQQFWQRTSVHMSDADEAFACKLLVAIALGSIVCLGRHATAEVDRAVQDQAIGWIAHAKQWLARKMATGVRQKLDIAQIVCLLALAQHTQHQHGVSPGGALLLGDHDPIRIGIQLGLHRDPRIRNPSVSPREAEMHRRLWATMLELSLQLCFDEGLPASLAPEGYDCEPPSSIADEDVDMGFGLSSFTSSTVLVLLSQTQRLRLRILNLINAPGGNRAYESSHQLAAELNATCSANMHTLRAVDPQTHQVQPSEFQVKMLDVFTRPFVLALHGPFADQASTKPAYYYSRKMRMEASAVLLAYPLRSVFDMCESAAASGGAAGAGIGGLDVGIDATAAAAAATRMRATTPPMAAAGTTDFSGAMAGGAVPEVPDAFAALRIHGHGHFSHVQRKATAALCLDLISELEENAFPTLHGASLQHLRGVLSGTVAVFERRMRAAAGTHSAREFVLFSVVAAYVDALMMCGGGQGRVRDVEEIVSNAMRSALASHAEVSGIRPAHMGEL